MEQKNQHFYLDQGTKEVIIKNQELATPFNPVKINISGDIHSPARFMFIRNEECNPKTTHLLVNLKDRTIEMKISDTDPYKQGIVKGALNMDKFLEGFGINGGKIYTLQEIKQKVKMNRAFFSDKDQHIKLLTNLEKFNASVKTQLEQHSDTRGNKSDAYIVKIDSNIDLNFTLKMPIFIGEKEYKFSVEICFDVREKAINIWLESPELQEIIHTETARIIDDALEPFKKQYVIINQ